MFHFNNKFKKPIFLRNCVHKFICLEGVDSNDWKGTYGVDASGDKLSLQFVTKGQYSTNIGSRVYLLDPSGKRTAQNLLIFVANP